MIRLVMLLAAAAFLTGCAGIGIDDSASGGTRFGLGVGYCDPPYSTDQTETTPPNPVREP